MLNSGPWDPWLPVVENSRLFAHRARCATLQSQVSAAVEGEAIPPPPPPPCHPAPRDNGSPLTPGGDCHQMAVSPPHPGGTVTKWWPPPPPLGGGHHTTGT